MHLLFLSRWFTYPANNGSKIRIYGLLQQLAQRYRVSLLSFVGPVALETSASVADLRLRLAENGQALVREKYDVRQVGGQFSRLIESLAEPAYGSIAARTKS